MVKQSIGYLFRFHTGYTAVGAFNLAVVQIIKYVLMYFEQQPMVQKNRCVVDFMGAMHTPATNVYGLVTDDEPSGTRPSCLHLDHHGPRAHHRAAH